jgi:hypothetical protein
MLPFYLVTGILMKHPQKEPAILIIVIAVSTVGLVAFSYLEQAQRAADRSAQMAAPENQQALASCMDNVNAWYNWNLSSARDMPARDALEVEREYRVRECQDQVVWERVARERVVQ